MNRFECASCGIDVFENAAETDLVQCKKCGRAMIPYLLPSGTVINTTPPQLKQMVMMSAGVLICMITVILGTRYMRNGGADVPPAKATTPLAREAK